MNRLATISSVLLLTLAAAPRLVAQRPADAQKPAEADLAPEALIQKGLEARRDGRNTDAVRLLQAAIAKIQAEDAGDLAAFLPGAMPGWKADDRKPTSGTWIADGQSVQWTQAQRTYSREKDGANVQLTITSWPQMLQGQRVMLQMFENPQMVAMLNSDPKKSIKPIEQGGFAGWKTVEKGDSAQVVVIGKALMVMVECSVDDENVLAHYWQGVDLAKLAVLDARLAEK